MSAFRGLTPLERAAMTKSVDRVYETFTEHVAAGRNLSIDQVLDIAGGRVWSGSKASRIGLVDVNGGLKAAIAVAVDKAGLGDNYFIEEVREMPQGLAAIFAALGARVKAHVEHSELFDLYVQNGIDLAFTGHAHGGQIRLPFVGAVYVPDQGFFPKYVDGVHEKDGTQMVVSRGLGGSFPIRTFNRPELVCVTLHIK